MPDNLSGHVTRHFTCQHRLPLSVPASLAGSAGELQSFTFTATGAGGAQELTDMGGADRVQVLTVTGRGGDRVQVLTVSGRGGDRVQVLTVSGRGVGGVRALTVT